MYQGRGTTGGHSKETDARTAEAWERKERRDVEGSSVRAVRK